MAEVLVLGPVTADIAALTDAMPKGNEDASVKETILRTGGSGYIVKRTFDALKQSCDIVFPLGTGVYADSVAEDLAKADIPVKRTTDAINGCRYTLVDKQGYTSLMETEGAQNAWETVSLAKLDLSAYAWIILDTEILHYCADEIMDLLKTYDGKLALILNEGGLMLDTDILSDLIMYDPLIHITDREAYYLSDSEESDEIIRSLRDLTADDVVILNQDLSAAVITADDVIPVTAERTPVRDRSGCREVHLASYICVLLSGLNRRQALRFACGYARAAAGSYQTVLKENEINTQRNLLAQAILG